MEIEMNETESVDFKFAVQNELWNKSKTSLLASSFVCTKKLAHIENNKKMKITELKNIYEEEICIIEKQHSVSGVLQITTILVRNNWQNL